MCVRVWASHLVSVFISLVFQGCYELLVCPLDVLVLPQQAVAGLQFVDEVCVFFLPVNHLYDDMVDKLVRFAVSRTESTQTRTHLVLDASSSQEFLQIDDCELHLLLPLRSNI